jgi:hypothetical protein
MLKSNADLGLEDFDLLGVGLVIARSGFARPGNLTGVDAPRSGAKPHFGEDAKRRLSAC